MSGIASFGDIGEAGLIRSISGPALQHKPPVAIAAIDIPMLVNLKIHFRMTQGRRTKTISTADRARAIAADTAGFDKDRFRRCDVHGKCE